MKFRAFLLVGCMVVVPAAAMFSHHLPPAFRAAPSRLLKTLAARLVAAGSRPPAVPAGPPSRAAVLPPADAPVAAVAGDEPTATAQLEALGAVAIECRPLPGGTGHLASCRVPVDVEGQLQRVFQAQAADADAALRGLNTAVAAWLRAVASRPATIR
jgi:hypothetical protein